MTISAALLVLGAAVATKGLSLVAAQRGAVLAWTHDACSAPLAANVGQFIESVTPGEGLIMSQLHKSIVDNLPSFQTSFAAGLDLRAGQLFDWSLKQGAAFVAKLAK